MRKSKSREFALDCRVPTGPDLTLGLVAWEAPPRGRPPGRRALRLGLRESQVESGPPPRGTTRLGLVAGAIYMISVPILIVNRGGKNPIVASWHCKIVIVSRFGGVYVVCMCVKPA